MNHVFGIIGTGMIGQEHIKNLKEFANVRIKWAAAKPGDEKQLREVQKKFNISDVTTNYSDLLNDEEVSAVIICTPPFLHKEMFIAALEKGKHILLEKPAAINPDELALMLEERKKYPHLKVLDCSCRHSRLQPEYRYIKSIIDSGRLGEIYYVHHNVSDRQGRPGIE